MAPPRSATDRTDRSLGARFAQAVATQDPAAMKAVLSPSVDFRALTPSRAWEADDAGTVADDIVFGTWFASDRRVTDLVSVETDRLGPVEQVRYRLAVTLPDGFFVVEQQAYLRGDGEQISWLRILCTGFLPADRDGSDGDTCRLPS
jgi:hypothetical protein